jgi:rhodanese-related sulfurtransferase/polyisoprenoid-binding protein YceI
MSIILAKELQVQLQEVQLIDVRLESDFEISHLPGALSNCVFEIGFFEGMTGMVPDQSQAICVYGVDEESHEARTAAEKLTRAGYQNVSEFRGGITEWTKEGLPTEGAEAASEDATKAITGVKVLRLDECQIDWTGRNSGSKHWGRLKLRPGELRFDVGRLVEGEMEIDMNSISNLNLEDGSMRRVLEDHLKSDDFFDVERYPSASIKLLSTEGIPDACKGLPYLRVRCQLTMKGISKELEFLAATGVNGDGHWTAQANFDFDRTSWGVIYGSGRFFRNLGMHLVNGLISMELKLVV